MNEPPFPMDASGSGRFRFCPKCSAPFGIRRIETRDRLVCPLCNFVYYQNPTVGVAAIVLSGDTVLLARHRKATSWHIPAGHVEYDEDVRAAAQRELLEETGLEINVGEVFEALSNFHSPESHTIGIWFRCEIVSGTPAVADDELAEVQFFPVSALPNLRHPTDGHVLARLRSEMSQSKGP